MTEYLIIEKNGIDLTLSGYEKADSAEEALQKHTDEMYVGAEVVKLDDGGEYLAIAANNINHFNIDENPHHGAFGSERSGR